MINYLSLKIQPSKPNLIRTLELSFCGRKPARKHPAKLGIFVYLAEGVSAKLH